MLITVSAAIAHLRLSDDYPASQLEVYCLAAEQSAQQFLNRRVFATAALLAAAVAAVPSAVAAASAACSSALVVADALEDSEARAMAREHAFASLRDAKWRAQETYQGLALDDPVHGKVIEAAMLLIVGHLYSERVDSNASNSVEQLPKASQLLLFPLRVGLGV